jgi:pyruvate dehydrogenase E2 component (dihydrolipoamide acetyltransferase)
VAIPITVPRLGWTMEEGTFVNWLKHDGDMVRPGDPLFVLESDKSSEEIESLDGGILRIPADSPAPGAKVKVGQVLAWLVAEGEEAPADCGLQIEDRRLEEPAPTAPTASRQTEAAQVREGRPAISPRARRAARELGVDWTVIRGSGRNGRIRERDIRATPLVSPPSPKRRGGTGGRGEPGRLVPHTPLRRTIATRTVAGVTQAAPVTLTVKVDATGIVRLRRQYQEMGGEIVPGYTDLLVKAVGMALRQHPLLQAQWRDEGLFVPERVDVAFAVDTEAGLLAPVIRDADRLTVMEVAAAARELVALARAGRLPAGRMRDATFTLSNLGMFGVDAFTPIINLPQCATLGVGRIVREPAVVQDAVVVGERMTFSLTLDHRVVDGAPAARFLDEVRQAVEQPAPWLRPGG